MRITLLLFTFLFLAACSQPGGSLEPQQVDTTGFVVVSTQVDNGNTNCRAHFASVDNTLVLQIWDRLNAQACDKTSLEYIPFDIVHRDEFASGLDKFSSTGVQRFGSTPIKRFLLTGRAWYAYAPGYAMPDAVVVLVPIEQDHRGR